MSPQYNVIESCLLPLAGHQTSSMQCDTWHWVFKGLDKDSLREADRLTERPSREVMWQSDDPLSARCLGCLETSIQQERPPSCRVPVHQHCSYHTGLSQHNHINHITHSSLSSKTHFYTLVLSCSHILFLVCLFWSPVIQKWLCVIDLKHTACI